MFTRAELESGELVAAQYVGPPCDCESLPESAWRDGDGQWQLRGTVAGGDLSQADLCAKTDSLEFIEFGYSALIIYCPECGMIYALAMNPEKISR